MSKSSTWAEMEEKRSLYLKADAEEVWVVSEEGQVRLFRDEEMETSELASGVPGEL